MNPLEQFRVVTLVNLPEILGVNLDFTNASVFMVLATLLTALLLYVGVRKASVIPGGVQTAIEAVYNFVATTLESNAGQHGSLYIPMVLSIFLFILACNLLGILPFGFTVTSQVAVTSAISFVVFVGTTTIGFRRQGWRFLRILLPDGTPLWLSPMMVFIKLCTYLSRPVSLSIRLAANMIAGHTIIGVIAEFVLMVHPLLTPLPFAFVIVLIGFEVFVAFLQAYIFVVLTSVYLADSTLEH